MLLLYINIQQRLIWARQHPSESSDMKKNRISKWVNNKNIIGRLWAQYRPPARPSYQELEIFRRHIEQVKKRNPNAKGLVLGSTSELADLLEECQVCFSCIDIDKKNYELMQKLRRYPFTGNLITGDWKTYHHEKADIIIGDASLNMLPLSAWNSVFKNLQCMFSDAAVLIHRFYQWNSEDYYHLGKFSETEFLETVEEGGRRGLDFYTSTVFYFYRSLLDTETCEISCKKWMEKVSELKEGGIIKQEDFETMKYLFAQAKIDFRMTIPRQGDIERIVKENGLRIVSETSADELFPFSRNCPIYEIYNLGS